MNEKTISNCNSRGCKRAFEDPCKRWETRYAAYFVSAGSCKSSKCKVCRYHSQITTEVIYGEITKEIDTVIFDIGNVLVHFDWVGYLKSLEFDEQPTSMWQTQCFEMKIGLPEI